MRRILTILLLTVLALSAQGQQYSFTFKLDGRTDTVMYIGRYYRDALTLVDTAKAKNGTYVFKGNRKWERGMYALVGQDGKKAVSDFCVDGSLKFSINGDTKLTVEGDVKATNGIDVDRASFGDGHTQITFEGDFDTEKIGIKIGQGKWEAADEDEPVAVPEIGIEPEILDQSEPEVVTETEAETEPEAQTEPETIVDETAEGSVPLRFFSSCQTGTKGPPVQML